jgi:putative hydrolase of the HAD superfamily
MTDPNSVLAVSFDVGGTLIEPWPSVGHIYSEVAAAAGLRPCEPELLNTRFNIAWNNRGTFDYSRRSWAGIVLDTFGGALDDSDACIPFFNKLYERFVEPDVWRVYEDVPPALQALNACGIRLAIISNWDDRLRLLLRNLKLDSFFETIEVSFESGFHKPAPEIFLRAARSLGFPPSSVLHVGDSFVEDFQGAEKAGFRALLIQRDKVGAVTNSIPSLLNLLEVLQRPAV